MQSPPKPTLLTLLLFTTLIFIFIIALNAAPTTPTTPTSTTPTTPTPTEPNTVHKSSISRTDPSGNKIDGVINPGVGKVSQWPHDMPPEQWFKVYSFLLSFQELNLAHGYGPYGEHRHDEKVLAQIRNDVIEFEHFWNNKMVYNLTHFTKQMDSFPLPPSDLMKNVKITQLSTNILLENVLKSIGVENQTNQNGSNSDLLKNNVKRNDNSIIDAEIDNELDPDLDRNYNIQHSAQQFISTRLPYSPYIRITLTSTDQDACNALEKWIENYPQLHNFAHIFLKFSKFSSIQGGYKPNTPKTYQTILYIEQDQLVLYGKHYSRLSSHGGNAGILFMVIIFVFVGSQIGLTYWQQTNQSSFDQFIVFCLWLVPLGVALLDHFKRFLIIWWVYSCTTAVVLSLLFIDLNPLANLILNALGVVNDDDGNNNNNENNNNNNNNFNNDLQNGIGSGGYNDKDIMAANEVLGLKNNNINQIQKKQKTLYIIPQRYIFSIVYKYFLLIHKFIMLLSTISIIVFFVDIFGIFQFLGLEPHMVGEMFHGHEATADEVLSFIMFALYGLFYSLYFGVLNRDIATIVIPQLTLLSTKFKLSKNWSKKDQSSFQADDSLDQSGDNNLRNDVKNNINNINNNDYLISRSSTAQQEQSTLMSTWDNVGNILNDGNTDSTTSVYEDDESFFANAEKGLQNNQNLPDHSQNKQHKQLPQSIQTQTIQTQTIQTQTKDSLQQRVEKRPAKTKTANKDNSCGICHELLKSKTELNNDNPSGTPSTSTSELPTIDEIRSRLRRQRGATSGNHQGGDRSIKKSHGMGSFLLNAFTTVLFYFIDFCDYCTGGSGQVNMDNVTLVEGMLYSINGTNDMMNANHGHNTQRRKNQQNNKNYYDDGFYDNQDDNRDEYGQIIPNNQTTATTTTTLIGNGSTFAMNNAAADNLESLQTHNTVVFKLPCQCMVHDVCLRGFMLLGKHNICPACKEISSFDVFVAPWDGVYDNYKNFLDSVKYCIAINPLLFFFINILLYLFW